MLQYSVDHAEDMEELFRLLESLRDQPSTTWQPYRPKLTKPQWTKTAAAPRRMLRCNRKGIGLRIKTIK